MLAHFVIYFDKHIKLDIRCSMILYGGETRRDNSDKGI